MSCEERDGGSRWGLPVIKGFWKLDLEKMGASMLEASLLSLIGSVNPANSPQSEVRNLVSTAGPVRPGGCLTLQVPTAR